MDIWDYLKSYQNMKESNPDKLETFVKSAGGELVPLHTVATAIDDLSADFGAIVGKMITINEERFREVISELPVEIQAKIKQKFMEAEDDLFAEGENNNAKENS